MSADWWPSCGLTLCPAGPVPRQVDCLESALERSLHAESPSGLQVSVLLDFTRGSRGGSAASLCIPWFSRSRSLCLRQHSRIPRPPAQGEAT